ncbi:MAG TPA: protein kinase [Candidatus Eisenbacteria bacterium]|nr:protein kinase [Candidatus Eisenbacteria bacterium]
MQLTPGSRLGTYEIRAPLGAGGMGEVYRALDTRLGREVAVKVLPEAIADSPQSLARFEREARAVAGLNHPNIVTLYSVEDEDGVRFLTMELIEGDSLARLIAPGGLPLARILDIFIPLADALATAHNRGVIHRDLKPGNVMVTRDGRVKVLDFGLAKIIDPAHQGPRGTAATIGDSGISAAGRVLGTVPYMAPEQIRGEPADARTDLFALGIVLYEAAAGRRPFLGSTATDVSVSILRDRPEPLSNRRPDLPDDFVRLVGRCLEKAPGARFQSASEFGQELRRLKAAYERGHVPTAAPRDFASIAVLPFVNRSREESDEYFSEGLADELLNVLSKIRGLKVAARTSSFQFKGRGEDLETIGRRLNVATLLDGSVRKSGNRVRISVHLVGVADGYHLWSETYDRTLDDIFAVQDDIAQSVVKELRTALLGDEADSRATSAVRAEVAKAGRGRARNPEAHRLYLQGRYFLDRQTRAGTSKGIEYLQEALALEPDFALAWAMLGHARTREVDSGWASVADGLPLARQAIDRALSLEPDLAEAHAGRGRIRHVYDWDLRGAEESIRHAMESAPGNTAVLRTAAELSRNLGRFEDAVAWNRRALEQDPLSAWAYSNLGLSLHASGQYGEAESMYRKGLELAPDRVGTHAALALVLLAQGRKDEARAEAKREPDEGYRLWVVGIAESAAGRDAESSAALRELIEKYADDSAYQIAEVCAARGEADAAFGWLDRAVAQRDGGLITELRTSPFFRAFHADPRWRALMKNLGFEGLGAA